MTAARVVRSGDVDTIPLAGDSWSRVLIEDRTVPGTNSALGYSVFRAGSRTDDLKHETDELAYVVSGSGSLHLEDERLAVGAGDALFIPAGAWHTVAASSAEDLAMVFSFPWPGYPRTERRPARP